MIGFSYKELPALGRREKGEVEKGAEGRRRLEGGKYGREECMVGGQKEKKEESRTKKEKPGKRNKEGKMERVE